ncbi:serine hydrolase FSH [Phaeosphaeriaceae sp. PMI808]|nr:serine hydrolase FSH [Phaeosphaeriaceae sp. PMI808]
MTISLPPPPHPIKILMLHGYTQSGPSFQAKTGALRKSLQKSFPNGCTLVYPTAPHRLSPADESFLVTEQENEQQLDAWAWWRRTATPPGAGGKGKRYTYSGLDTTFAFLARLMKDEGPFTGVIGFSQGAALAALLASLLEPHRESAFAQSSTSAFAFPHSFTPPPQPPFKFAVCYSGFRPDDDSPYAPFFEPRIETPTLHFFGMQDVVVEERRGVALVDHPGGHFLPGTQKASVGALIGFMKEVLGEKEEESVEDMDVPF